LKKINNRKKKRSNFTKRVITGIILIVVGIIFLSVPPLIFALGLIVLIGQGIREIIGMSKNGNQKRCLLSAVLVIYLCLSLSLFYFLRFGTYFSFSVLSFSGLGEIGQFWLLLGLVPAGIFDPTAYFVGKNIGRLKKLRQKLWLLLGLVPAGIAHSAGKTIEGHKITPNISPGKTWEGTIAAFITSPIATYLIGRTFLPFSVYQLLALGLLLAFLAFFGDLLISLYKRKMEAKDSGNALPGHGGLLDMIDSSLPVVLGVALVKILVSLVS